MSGRTVAPSVRRGPARPLRLLVAVAGLSTALPAAQGAAAQDAAALAEPTVAAEFQAYRHAIGFTFQYPKGWELTTTEQGIVLIPAGAARDAQGNPLELLIIGAEGAPGIVRPDDPRVVAYFEQNQPGMRRVGAPDTLRSGLGPGAVLSFEGSGQGLELYQRIYVTLHDGLGIYLGHMARRDLAAAREPAAGYIFGSFGWATPEIDPAIVRSWSRSTTEGSAGATGGVFTNTSTLLSFHADGTVTRQTRSRVDATVGGAVGYSDGGPGTARGRFAAADGRVTVYWQNGDSEVFEYSVFLDDGGVPALKLQAPGGRPLYFR